MIKIRIGKLVETFENDQLAMDYIADLAGEKSLRFQKIEISNGEISQMDYLTYYQGRVKETYSTSS